MDKQATLMSAAALQDQRDDPLLRIIDCRFNLLEPDAGRAMYLSGHIPGAVYADLNRDLAAPVRTDSGRHPLPEAKDAVVTMARLGIGPQTQVVVYDDRSGAIAARAWWLLRWLGHHRAAVLDGGMTEWLRHAYSIESGDVAVQPQDFVGNPRPEMVIETTELLGAKNTGPSIRMVDARDAARFRGEQEPIDSKAGHIRGALNLPFANSLDADGLWKPGFMLRENWIEVLGEDHNRPFGVMCGSGVTACHLVVSALLARLSEPRVYVGSWSEWIRDPQRPVASGSA